MKDILNDIIAHTHNLGIFDTIKVSAGDTTQLESESDDRAVILRAETKQPIDGFTGVFGMPNITQLAVLLGLDEYRNDVNISVLTNNGLPTGLKFVNAAGDFENEYRFMAESVINDKMKPMQFNEPPYEVVIKPTMAAHARLRQQAKANANEPLFSVKAEDGNLVFNFGDPSTSSGKFVFESGVSDDLSTAWSYPATNVLGILSLDGDITMKFSNAGALVFTVDSGQAVYTYILPAHVK